MDADLDLQADREGDAIPVLLTDADLRPLFFEDVLGLVDAAEGALRENTPPRHDNSFIRVPLGPEGVAVAANSSDSLAFGAVLHSYVRGADSRPMTDADGLLMDVTLLFDVADGNLEAILCTREYETVRIPVQTAVGCRYLAPSGSRVLGVMGSSVQARGHIPILLKTLPTIEEVRIYSPAREHREGLARDLDGSLEADVRAVETARAAIEEADVLLAAANSDAATFEPGWVKPGGLVASISRRQLPTELALSARVIPSNLEGYEYTVGGGRRAADHAGRHDAEWRSVRPAGSLLDVVRGDIRARERDQDTILFLLTGIPAIGAALARHVLEWAAERGLGTRF